MSCSKLEKFRLLDMPLVALRKIVVQLDFFQFALTNSACFQIIKYCRFESIRLKVIHTTVEHGFELIVYPFLFYTWNFEKRENVKDALEFNKEYVIDGINYPTREWDDDCLSINLTSLCDDPAVTSDQFLAEIMKLFNNRYLTYEFHLDPKIFKNRFDFNQYLMEKVIKNEKCKQLELGDWDYYQKNARAFPLESEDLEFVLDNLREDCGLNIIGNPGNHFIYDKPISLKRLSIGHGDWFTFNNLINSKCHKIQIDSSKFQLSDFKEFLKKWINGETNRELRYLSVRVGNELSKRKGWHLHEEYRKQVFDGFLYYIHNQKRNLEDYEHNELKEIYKNVTDEERNLYRDIQRSDGLNATIAMRRSEIILAVWHEKHGK